MKEASTPMYTKVPFSKLQTYLNKNASAEEVNYIEVTDIAAAKLSGKRISPLGKILKECGKKIALKLPDTIKNLHSMEACFYGCPTLISLAAFPKGITVIRHCFSECTGLTQAPVIPNTVSDMECCFFHCSNLTEAPAIPKGITSMDACFSGCTALTEAPCISNSVTDMERLFFQLPQSYRSSCYSQQCYEYGQLL